MDHGPIVTQFKEEILPEDNSETLRNRIFEKSAEVLVEMLPAYIHGKIKPKVQNDEEATFTKLMKKEDGFIDLTTEHTPENIERFIRAMSPWPGAWTLVKLNSGDATIKRLKLLGSHIENEKLVLDEVQLEGKDPVSWKQYKEGYKEAEFCSN